jgi:hypothetical protein
MHVPVCETWAASDLAFSVMSLFKIARHRQQRLEMERPRGMLLNCAHVGVKPTGEGSDK